MTHRGTGALKTDFTRTGKRTLRGIMNDGWNSTLRFYINNFLDGSRQVSQPVHFSMFFLFLV